MVIGLTATLIVGVIVTVGALVTRLPVRGQADSGPALPEEIALPRGVTARAVTFGPDWYAVVTGDDRILIFARPSGDLRQEVAIMRAAPLASAPVPPQISGE